MSTADPELRAHKEWLGLLQPIGLVVTPPALVRKQAVPDRDQAVRMQVRLRELVGQLAPAELAGSTASARAARPRATASSPDPRLPELRDRAARLARQ